MRQTYYQPPRVSKAVKYLLIATVSIYLVQLTSMAFSFPFVDYFGFSAHTFFAKGRIWQILTYPFLHGPIFHILFNCMGLFMLGPELESRWGFKRFMWFYAVCAMGGAVFQSLLWLFGLATGIEGAIAGGSTFIIGASGALYGMFVAFGRLYGESQILVAFLFPMKAKYFVMLLTGIEIVSAVFFNNSGLAHLVHLGGLATGFLILFFRGNALDGRGGYKFRRKKSMDRDEVRRRLNLIVNKKDNDDDDKNPPPGKKYPITWN